MENITPPRRCKAETYSFVFNVSFRCTGQVDFEGVCFSCGRNSDQATASVAEAKQDNLIDLVTNQKSI